MRRYIPIVALLLVIAHSGGCSRKPMLEEEKDARGRLTPTPDPYARGGIYIPEDLETALAELDNMLSDEFRRDFAADSSAVGMHHFGLGLWMRNNWGLWGDSRLAKYFNSLGIAQPDDMSGILLTSYWQKLNGRPILLQEQIDGYRRGH